MGKPDDVIPECSLGWHNIITKCLRKEFLTLSQVITYQVSVLTNEFIIRRISEHHLLGSVHKGRNKGVQRKMKQSETICYCKRFRAFANLFRQIFKIEFIIIMVAQLCLSLFDPFLFCYGLWKEPVKFDSVLSVFVCMMVSNPIFSSYTSAKKILRQPKRVCLISIQNFSASRLWRAPNR